ncbi:MAG: DUF4442 domain-containing protein [Phaeodactylibacter sp.]|nr:DUF4442 domain-containing protein [Phaeodactylibacter sp.]MCB9289838.1 DUF4442 domain-containing protein [Lewinellaceae bacterium]
MDTERKAIPVFDAEAPGLLSLIRNLSTPWKMRLYFLRRLPSCWFWGVRISEIATDRCRVTIPYSWRTQNPFRSIYFAALAGAAELSTGALALIALHGRGRISMLITGIEGQFTKKANTLTTFTCEHGEAILETVQNAIDKRKGQTVRVLTIGTNEAGEEVCRFWLTWSFKVKS